MPSKIKRLTMLNPLFENQQAEASARARAMAALAAGVGAAAGQAGLHLARENRFLNFQNARGLLPHGGHLSRTPDLSTGLSKDLTQAPLI